MKPITADTDRRMTVLVIGKPGAGKTSLLRTIPEGEKVFVASAEAGLLAVNDLLERNVIEGWVIQSLADVDSALMHLESDPGWCNYYQWVFVDSLTELSAMCYLLFKDKYQDRKDSFNLWESYSNRITGIIKRFRDLPRYNVVMTCLEKVETDEAKRRFVLPDVQMKGVSSRLPSYFDEVFYMTDYIPRPEAVVKGPQPPPAPQAPARVFHTQPSNYQPGKDRSGKLAPVEPASLAHIKGKIFGGTK
jgi:hypothetical protein